MRPFTAERERESKEALAQQKRKVTRQWEVLARVKKRHEALEGRAAADNAQLSDEYMRVTRAFAHLQAKYRHFKAADLAKFEQVGLRSGMACTHAGCMANGWPTRRRCAR